MCPDVDHVLLTRFNLPSPGAESVIRAQDGWLTARSALFEKYCVPSVLAQSNANFQWIIYFDPDSPGWLRERIEDHRARAHFIPVFRESVSPAELLSDIQAAVGAVHTHLITTNLDNDDALAVDFVDRVQKCAPSSGRIAIYLGTGLIAAPSGLYRRTDKDNAFCSVRESWDSPVTCWVDWHNRLSKQMPARSIGGEPGWLQVVHGTNVSNRVRGSLTSPRQYRNLFDGLLDEMRMPGSSSILIDRWVSSPIRIIKDGGRLALKRTALALLGSRRFESAKAVVARTITRR